MRIAVDSGGTFTDAVALHEGSLYSAKVLSTPDDPSVAVLQAIEELCEAAAVGRPALLIHGTTVATNSLLEGMGADTLLVTNRGFGGMLAIGRQARDELYALQPKPRQRLVTDDETVELAGRVAADGSRVDELELAPLLERLESLDDSPRAWAILLLHSYAEPDDERAVAAAIREARPQDVVCASHEVLPVFREVERGETTLANAFVQPRMASYLKRLEAAAERVLVMGSHGGTLTLDQAIELPVQTALSGPAAGVVAAAAAASRMGVGGVISFDMGGTSTDVALVQGALPLRRGARVGAHSLHLPLLDIHTVGSGGGSIAWLDAAGVLKVGPQSAGASPGPAAYGVGQLPTVTDANVVLGRLPTDLKLGGRHSIQPQRSYEALAALAASLSSSVEDTARAIIEIANAHMVRAIRRISVERGVDPRPLWLVAYGGAGGLHAAAIAEALGMRGVLRLPRAGLLSAVGMLLGAPKATRELTVLGRGDSEVAANAASLAAAAREAVGGAVELRVEAACRFEGQGYELDVPWTSDHDELSAAFKTAHAQRFGYLLDRPIELVTLRATAVGEAPEQVEALWNDDARPRESQISGPRSLVSDDTTWWIPEGWVLSAGSEGISTLTREAL